MHIHFIVQFLNGFNWIRAFFLERILDVIVIVPTWLLNDLGPLMHYIVCGSPAPIHILKS